MILYRPIGHKELELIVEAGLRGFPPRLPDQPIFYPVLSAGYAREIAEGWNTKSDTYAGYITRFNLANEYFQKFEIQTVGAKKHREIWVPAEELEEFNNQIIGHIEVIAAYFGKGFVGSLPEVGPVNKTADAAEYLQRLMATMEYNGMDFRGSIVLNYKSVYCNYAYWKQFDVSLLKSKGNSGDLVPRIAEAWHDNFPGVKLPTEVGITEAELKDIA